jgi:hypothetical protein
MGCRGGKPDLRKREAYLEAVAQGLSNVQAARIAYSPGFEPLFS